MDDIQWIADESTPGVDMFINVYDGWKLTSSGDNWTVFDNYGAKRATAFTLEGAKAAARTAHSRSIPLGR